ncbi:hypothetical protein EXN66_Car022090 [Channa argus]|uniref:Uncharacterized protein n=1 Tax=Channa argus TaxID=215402 RepID=A0A6G1QW01_CHAAH|nr:hypothetical protein EXN66_Car022090 [Channa argus]
MNAPLSVLILPPAVQSGPRLPRATDGVCPLIIVVVISRHEIGFVCLSVAAGLSRLSPRPGEVGRYVLSFAGTCGFNLTIKSITSGPLLSMAEGVRPEDYCDEPAEDEFGEIIKCRSVFRAWLQVTTTLLLAYPISSGSPLSACRFGTVFTPDALPDATLPNFYQAWTDTA